MTESELKHLDYIQSTISRIASNQFQIKGWSITLSTALLTIFANSFTGADGPNTIYLLIAIFPTVIFWIIDSRFLALERRLRQIYMNVAEHNESIKPFDMPIHLYTQGKYSTLHCMFTFGNMLVYLLSSVCFLAGFIALRIL